jgi:hypothetical protein
MGVPSPPILSLRVGSPLTPEAVVVPLMAGEVKNRTKSGKPTAMAKKPKTTNAPDQVIVARRKRRPPEQAVIPGWTPKPGGALPPHQPTERTRTLVELMTSYGASQPQIATVLDIHLHTLVKHYRQELTLGAERANMAVARNLYRIATTPKNTAPIVNAAVWWTKARMGWSEIRRTMADVRTLSANVRDLTDAELIAIVEQGGMADASQPGALPAPSKPRESG